MSIFLMVYCCLFNKDNICFCKRAIALQLERRLHAKLIELVLHKRAEDTSVGFFEKPITDAVAYLCVRFYLWRVELTDVDSLTVDKVR